MNSTRLKITRTYKDKCTLGDLDVFDERGGIKAKLKCIELPWLNNAVRKSCIPEGVYDVIKHSSPKYGVCFWVLNVSGRSEILIHVGNYVEKNGKIGDTLGCILPGLSFADINYDGVTDVVSSRAALNKLLELLPDRFKLQITK